MDPLLFLLFINDMRPIFEYSSYKLYANDTAFYTTNQDELAVYNLIYIHFQNGVLIISYVLM